MNSESATRSGTSLYNAPSFDLRPPSMATMPSSRLQSSRNCTPRAQASRFQGGSSHNSPATPAAAKTSDRIEMPSAVRPDRTADLERKAAQRVERLVRGRRASGILDRKSTRLNSSHG